MYNCELTSASDPAYRRKRPMYVPGLLWFTSSLDLNIIQVTHHHQLHPMVWLARLDIQTDSVVKSNMLTTG